jgi:mRNA interferase MazF
MSAAPDRGDVWMVGLDPVRGREQAGLRPCLVVSVDLFNHGPSELAIVLPLTSKDKAQPLHVPIDPPEGGLRLRSFAKCEDVRSVSRDRLGRRLGSVSRATLAAVEERLRILLEL